MTPKDDWRVAPSDVEAEEELLGGLLLVAASERPDRMERIAAVVGRVQPDDLYRESHRRILRAIVAAHGRGRAPDVLAVSSELERSKELELHPGEIDQVRAVLRGLAQIAPSTANLPACAEHVHEIGDRLRVHRAGVELIDAARNGGLSADKRDRVRDLLTTTSPDEDATRLRDGAAWTLDTPTRVESVWGYPNAPLWAAGEPLMIFAPEGVGKTTTLQQLILGRIGLRDELLGLAVETDARPCLYVAADRPRQQQRSLARMVGAKDADVLREKLIVHEGSPPFDLFADPDTLANWAATLGVGTVFLDSLGDLAIDLIKDETGSRIKASFRQLTTTGVELAYTHHPRKSQGDNRKPRKIDDVYGSRWISAGTGSVIVLWGEPGDPVVELIHLKQPAEEVGPLTIVHDHQHGITTVAGDNFDLDRFLADRPDGVSAKTTAALMFTAVTPTRNQVEKARRKLERAVSNGTAERIETTRADEPVVYTPRRAA